MNEFAMRTAATDLTVFAQDYPEARLAVAVKSSLSSPAELDKAVTQVARHMWGSTCHFGLIITPGQTYVLRDDFTSMGPMAIRVTDTVPTAVLLSRLGHPLSEQPLAALVREWLQRLVSSYEAALPEDPEVTRALFPDIVGAVTGAGSCPRWLPDDTGSCVRRDQLPLRRLPHAEQAPP
jgi:hypothetical protein